MSETRVPAIPAVTSSNLTDVAKAVKQILDVREGVVGDPLDANITFRDLVNAGLAELPLVRVGTRGAVPIVPLGAGPDGYDPTADRIPPPAPENFTATGAFATVLLQWDEPQYRNHAYTEIWRSSSNLLSQAVLIGTSATRFYADSLGTSTTAYYWGRHVSLANVSGAYSSLLGTAATTATDPALVLASLTGQITESQLYNDLAQRIDLIDGPSTLAGSVAARLASEAQARATAIQDEADARTLAIDFESQARADAILDEANSRTSAISAATNPLQTQIDLLSAASAGDVGELIAIVKAEETSRVTSDEAFARTGEVLFAINANNAAAIKTESTARSTADSAQASSLSVLYVTTGDAKAAVVAESKVRAAGDTSTASQLSGLSAISSANSAGIALERQVSASQSSAIADQASALTAIAGGSSAALQVEQQARSNADAASASQAVSLAAALSDSRSSLQVEQSVRSTADLSLSTQVTTIAASSGGNTAGLQVEQTARASQDSSLASQVSSFSAISGANSAAISIEQKVSIDRDLSLASQVSGFTSTLGSTVSSLQVEQQTRSSQDNALSSQITRALAKTDEGTAALLAEQVARVTADQATASFSSSLASTFGNSNSALVVEQLTRASADSASAGLVSNLNTAVGASGSAIKTEELARSSASSALSSQLLNLSAATGANSAAIRSEIQARTDQDVSVSSVLQTIQASAAGNTASIQQEITTRATETGSLFAKYGVKVDVAGHVSGFGLLSTLNTATPTSSFGVRADQFFISPPSVASATAPTQNLYDGYVWLDTSVTPNVTRYRQSGAWVTSSPRLPFVVQATPTTINGVSVPAGVYIDTAFIRDGTITTAKIGNAAIDNAKIAIGLDATKITTGFLDADRIESESITADKIDARNLTIKDSLGNVILSSGTPLSSAYIAAGQGKNLLFNGSFKDSAIGSYLGANTTGGPVILGRNLSPDYTLAGEGTAYMFRAGALAAGTQFQVAFNGGISNIPVLPGQRVEGYALLNTHRCTGEVLIAFYKADGTLLGSNAGNSVSYQSTVQSLSNLRMSLVFGVAPPLAASCILIIRATATGANDPYLFFSRCFLGIAGAAQTEASPWSDGGGIKQITPINASTFIAEASIGNAQIDELSANKITSGYINASRINTDTITAGMIVSRSATSFEMIIRYTPNGVWSYVDFYMDHVGIASVILAAAWNATGNANTYTFNIGLTDGSATSPPYQQPATATLNQLIPNPPVLMISRYLSAGWNRAWVFAQISIATSDHYAQFAIFKSYR